MADRYPALTPGPMTRVATLPPPPRLVDPSSHVMKTTLPVMAEVRMIRGRKPRSHASPLAIEQSCIELHMFGTISSKFAAHGLKCLKSRMSAQRRRLRLMSVKLIAGSCLRAYDPVPSGPPLAVAPL